MGLPVQSNEPDWASFPAGFLRLRRGVWAYRVFRCQGYLAIFGGQKLATTPLAPTKNQGAEKEQAQNRQLENENRYIKKYPAFAGYFFILIQAARRYAPVSPEDVIAQLITVTLRSILQRVATCRLAVRDTMLPVGSTQSR